MGFNENRSKSTTMLYWIFYTEILQFNDTTWLWKNVWFKAEVLWLFFLKCLASFYANFVILTLIEGHLYIENNVLKNVLYFNTEGASEAILFLMNRATKSGRRTSLMEFRSNFNLFQGDSWQKQNNSKKKLKNFFLIWGYLFNL